MTHKPAFEKQAYELLRSLKDPVLRPVVATLAFFHVTPTMVTLAGVICMILFAWTISINLTWALTAFICALVADWLDGSLARFTHSESPFGKFTDFLADYTVFAIFIFGLTRVHLVSGAWAVSFVYCATLAKVLLLVKKHFADGMTWQEWLTKPVGGALPQLFVFLSYFSFVLYVFCGINSLPEIAIGATCILTLGAVRDYFVIRKTSPWRG